MGDVVELRQAEPKESHVTGEAFCVQCNHEWVAVAPAGTTQLECPECRTEKGLFKFPCRPPEGEQVWTCNCGNHLFYMTPDGHLCPNCGTHQEYPAT